MLTPGALARDIAALANGEIGWTTSRVLDLLPDGSTVGFDQDPPAGPIERGAVLDHWKHGFTDDTPPTRSPTACRRTTGRTADRATAG